MRGGATTHGQRGRREQLDGDGPGAQALLLRGASLPPSVAGAERARSHLCTLGWGPKSRHYTGYHRAMAPVARHDTHVEWYGEFRPPCPRTRSMSFVASSGAVEGAVLISAAGQATRLPR